MEATVENTVEVTNEVPAENQVEEQARHLGWRPKEEFEGPTDRWVDADEFIKRQPLFEKIDSLKTELWQTKQEYRKELDVIKGHFSKVQENAYKQALKDLKSQRVEAMAERDTERALQIEEQIDVLEDEVAKQKAAHEAQIQTQKAPNPVFVNWVEKNTWYAQDPDMRAEADAFALTYVGRNPNKELGDVLQYVNGKMKQMYPDKFGSKESRQEIPSVEAPTPSANRGKLKLSEKDLSPEEREVMNTIVVRHKLMSKEDYLKQLNNSN